MYPEIPKGTKRLRGETKVTPAGCACQGCCAVIGLSKPQYGWQVRAWGDDFQWQLVYGQNEASKEEIEAINNHYGLVRKSQYENPMRYFVGYFDELKRSMEWLATKDDTLFLGQSVLFPGTAMHNTVKDIDESKRIEMPVAEAMQMGITTGLAVQGFVPVSIYPRWNFLLLATDGLVNHLDKLPLISDYKPKVILRTSIGSIRPLDPQEQHKGDFTEAFRLMLKTVEVIRLEEPEQIFPAYQRAYERTDGKSTLLVEYGDYYNEK
jgi:hypothetical protein